MTRTRYKFGDAHHPHFLTCSIVGWLPVFARPELAQIVLDSWKFLQSHDRLVMLGYVIMENHVHFIASAASLGKEVGDCKSFTARKIVDWLEARKDYGLLGQMEQQKAKFKPDREYQVWQEGSHPQQIVDEAMMWQKLEYIHNNPVRRGYVDDPLHWRYSSARNYARLAGVISVVTDWM